MTSFSVLILKLKQFYGTLKKMVLTIIDQKVYNKYNNKHCLLYMRILLLMSVNNLVTHFYQITMLLLDRFFIFFIIFLYFFMRAYVVGLDKALLMGTQYMLSWRNRGKNTWMPLCSRVQWVILFFSGLLHFVTCL